MSVPETHLPPETSDILIYQDDQQLGPMSWEDVNSGILRMKIDVLTALAWFPGLPNWVPLATVEGPFTTIGTDMDPSERRFRQGYRKKPDFYLAEIAERKRDYSTAISIYTELAE